MFAATEQWAPRIFRSSTAFRCNNYLPMYIDYSSLYILYTQSWEGLLPKPPKRLHMPGAFIRQAASYTGRGKVAKLRAPSYAQCRKVPGIVRHYPRPRCSNAWCIHKPRHWAGRPSKNCTGLTMKPMFILLEAHEWNSWASLYPPFLSLCLPVVSSLQNGIFWCYQETFINNATLTNWYNPVIQP